MTDYSDLRALALAATPGPWWQVADFVMGPDGDAVASCGGNIAIGTYAEADAAYIAACSPDRILALLDRLAALERVAEAARVLRDQHTPDPEWPSGSGYDESIPGGYGVIDPACRVCGTPDEYAVAWPCGEHLRLCTALAALEEEK